MKSADEIRIELTDLLGPPVFGNRSVPTVYDVANASQFYRGLTPEDQARANDVLDQMLGNPIYGHAVAQVAAEVGLTSIAPKIAEKLTRATTSADQIYFMLALSDLGHVEAVPDIEKRVGTEFNHQALIALARLDVERATSYLHDQAREYVAGNPLQSQPFEMTLKVVFLECLEDQGLDAAREVYSVICGIDEAVKEAITPAFRKAAAEAEQDGRKMFDASQVDYLLI